MKDFAKQDINFTIVRVNKDCDQMIKVMETIYQNNGKKLNVSDLADACKNLSAADVTKKFVEAASFMLSTTLGGTSGKGKRTGDPLWAANQLTAGQVLSQAAYY